MYNFKNFQPYQPSDAQEGVLYWKSEDGTDWRVAKALIEQESEEYVFVYTHSTGKIISVNPDLESVIPVNLSVLSTTSELPLDGNIKANYRVVGDGLEGVDNSAVIAEKWEQIKRIRDTKATDGILIQSVGKWFHTDAMSLIQYLALNLQMTKGKFKSKMWKTLDGTFVPLNELLIEEIFDTAIQSMANLFEIAETHRNLLNSSDNPLSYDITTLWPDTYSNINK